MPVNPPFFPLKVDPSAKALCETLHAKGFQAFLVGGCVRDAFLGLEPKDWDIATDATPNQIQRVFPRTIPTGIDFGTVTVLVDMEPFEVTTFRADSPSSDGRRPDSVAYSETIEEDLARRDFTCNAIAYDPLAGALVDPFNGVGALKLKVLEAVGDPVRRFQEDGLRILRAIRFASTKGFSMHGSLRAAIPACLDMLDQISKERVRDELLKILGGSGVGVALEFMQTSGVFGKICPELTRQPGLSQNRHHAYDIWEHTRRCVEADRTGKPLLRLAILLHDIAKPATRRPHPKNKGEFQFLDHEELGADMAMAWMREYRFSREEVSYVGHLIRHHLIFFTPDWPDKTLRRWLRRVGKEHLEDLLALRLADIIGKGPYVDDLLREHALLAERVGKVETQVPHSMAHLALKGQDVMRIRGITGGPLVGKILNHLLDAVTDDPQINTVEGLTPLVEAYAP